MIHLRIHPLRNQQSLGIRKIYYFYVLICIAGTEKVHAIGNKTTGPGSFEQNVVYTRQVSLSKLAVNTSLPDSLILRYPFNNSSDGKSGFGADTMNSALLSAASVSKGPGLGQFAVGTDSWSGTIELLKTGPGTQVAGATAADALSNDWYYEVTLTPKTAINIRAISIDWSRGGTTGDRGWYVRSSLDGYNTNLYSNYSPSGTSFGLKPASFNLTGFTNITTTTTFRFYIYTERTSRYMDFQNLAFYSYVRTPPSISNEPKNLQVCAFADTSFSLSIDGDWDSVQWQSNKGSSWQRVAGGIDTTYRVINADSSLNGAQYRAIVFGAGSKDTSNVVTLSLNITPVNIKSINQPSSGQSNGSIDVDVNNSSLLRYCRWSTKQGISYPTLSDFDLSNAGEGTYYLLLVGEDCVEYAGPYTLGIP